MHEGIKAHLNTWLRSLAVDELDWQVERLIKSKPEYASLVPVLEDYLYRKGTGYKEALAIVSDVYHGLSFTLDVDRINGAARNFVDSLLNDDRMKKIMGGTKVMSPLICY